MKKNQKILIAVFSVILILAMVYNFLNPARPGRSGFSFDSNWYNAHNLDKEEKSATLDSYNIDIKTNGTVIIKSDSSVSEPTLNYYTLIDDGEIVFDLSVEGSSIKQLFENNMINNSEAVPITLLIPDNENNLKLTSDFDAANIFIDDVNLMDSVINVDAGNLEIESDRLSQTQLIVNAGNVEIEAEVVSDVEIQVDAGNLELDSTLDGHNKVEVNLGNFDGNIDNLQELTYHFKVNLGEIDIEGRNDNGSEFSQDGNPNKSLEVQVDLGNIELSQ